MSRHPKISVITVVYNDFIHIEQTILSVLNQTYDNIEYILIDGGSSDGTVDVIKKYADRLSYWISEPDKGIYDAMNKGIEQLHGIYVNFMNSGDSFYSENVIKEVVEKIAENKPDIIYGDVQMNFSHIENFIRRYNELDLTNISTNLCHQATFSSVELMKKYKFDTSFEIAADANFFSEIYKKEKACFMYVPIVIACYEAENGLSAKNLRKLYQEYMRVYGYKKCTFQWIKRTIQIQLKLIYYSIPSKIRWKIHSLRIRHLYKF